MCQTINAVTGSVVGCEDQGITVDCPGSNTACSNNQTLIHLTGCNYQGDEKIIHGNVSTVTELQFTDNRIKNMRNILFSKFDSVQSLTLRNNGVDNYESDFLKSLQHLENLTIIEKKLRINKDIIYNTTDLQAVYLDVKFINSQQMNTLPGTLRIITIVNTTIKLQLDEGKLSLNGDYPQLETLVLKNCALEGIALNRGNLDSLVNLDLSDNKLSWTSIKLNDSKSLKKLILNNNRIKIIMKEYLMKFANIEQLSLKNNDLYYIDQNAFDTNCQLKFIDLSDNKLTKIYLPNDRLSQLTVIVDNNNLECLFLEQSGAYKAMKYTGLSTGHNYEGIPCVQMRRKNTIEIVLYGFLTLTVGNFLIFFCYKSWLICCKKEKKPYSSTTNLVELDDVPHQQIPENDYGSTFFQSHTVSTFAQTSPPNPEVIIVPSGYAMPGDRSRS